MTGILIVDMPMENAPVPEEAGPQCGNRSPENVPGKSFDEWIKDWLEILANSQEYAKSPMPLEVGTIQSELDRVNREHQIIGDLIPEADWFITTNRAKETLDVKADPKFSDLTGAERKSLIESRVAHMVRVRDIIKVTEQALKQRRLSLLSARKRIAEEMTGLRSGLK